MTHKVKLTGKTRLRVHKQFRKTLLVLQVEERNTGYYVDMHGSWPDFDYLTWRDARLEDISETSGESKS